MIDLISGVSIVLFTFASTCALCSSAIWAFSSSSWVLRIINGSTLLAISLSHLWCPSRRASSFAIWSCIERHSFLEIPPPLAYAFSRDASLWSIIKISLEISRYSSSAHSTLCAIRLSASRHLSYSAESVMVPFALLREILRKFSRIISIVSRLQSFKNASLKSEFLLLLNTKSLIFSPSKK